MKYMEDPKEIIEKIIKFGGSIATGYVLTRIVARQVAKNVCKACIGKATTEAGKRAAVVALEQTCALAASQAAYVVL